MFGANRKKFMEGGIESDYTDDSSLYYTQQSMFPPHRPDKDVSPLLHRLCRCSINTVKMGINDPNNEPLHILFFIGRL